MFAMVLALLSVGINCATKIPTHGMTDCVFCNHCGMPERRCHCFHNISVDSYLRSEILRISYKKPQESYFVVLQEIRTLFCHNRLILRSDHYRSRSYRLLTLVCSQPSRVAKILHHRVLTLLPLKVRCRSVFVPVIRLTEVTIREINLKGIHQVNTHS